MAVMDFKFKIRALLMMSVCYNFLFHMYKHITFCLVCGFFIVCFEFFKCCWECRLRERDDIRFDLTVWLDGVEMYRFIICFTVNSFLRWFSFYSGLYVLSLLFFSSINELLISILYCSVCVCVCVQCALYLMNFSFKIHIQEDIHNVFFPYELNLLEIVYA